MIKHRSVQVGLFLLVVSLATVSITRASSHTALGPTTPSTVTVDVGYGEKGGDAIIFTPRWIDVYVGDTVIWRDLDALDGHTVSFGSKATLDLVLKQAFVPVPQKNGPPMLALSPKVVLPTTSPTYDGTGYANSGVLSKGKTWSLTFTAPGTYRYLCILHAGLGGGMSGVVVVHPRPLVGRMYFVQAGDSQAAHDDTSNQTLNQSFFPQRLTVHVGDTVTWTGGLHNVAFGPEALRAQLEKHIFTPVPQKSGPPLLAFNPRIAFPSGGNTYDGAGFVNSGILLFTVKPGSTAPPMFHLTFTKAGAYEYDCLLHPHMEGSITVLPAAQ